jgi:hypothetical protein
LLPAAQHRSITEQRDASKTKNQVRAEDLERRLAEEY